MSCYPCAAADITLAMHNAEIPPRDFYTVNLDHLQSGLGGTNSWGALALPKYQITPGKIYRWSFLLSLGETPALPQGGRMALPPGLPGGPPGLPGGIPPKSK